MPTISPKIASIATKALGITGAAAVAYDSHKCGMQGANAREYTEASTLLEQQYWNSLNQDSRSTIVSKLKDKLFDLQVRFTTNNFVSKVKGYLSGFGNHAVSNLITLGLSAGAIFLKKGNKLCAAGVALMAAKTLLYDVLGIGRKQE